MKETAAKLPSLGSNPLDDKNQPLPSIQSKPQAPQQETEEKKEERVAIDKEE